MSDDRPQPSIYETLRDVAHALGVCFEADGHNCEPGHLEDLLARVAELSALEREASEACIPRERDAWHEDHGNVLWWRFPVVEAPYCGSPLDSDFPDYATHWTPLPEVFDPTPERDE